MIQLTISSLITELNKVQAEHGDLPVVLADADMDYLCKLETAQLQVDKDTCLRTVLVVQFDYAADEEGTR